MAIFSQKGREKGIRQQSGQASDIQKSGFLVLCVDAHSYHTTYISGLISKERTASTSHCRLLSHE